ncbi:LOW QUALITY PROTEIN: tRNA-dihydrouridine(20) synthase [NAD(P)+]-like [Haliotis rubra]|uniref:LOW QUALITY PROTEIN: tRNA-dihydrouridine(20) synthase [NAD(P)+]-like n=1 Tax=Haliotis rubra TaxID=36100 RepID=UPI001EE50744|nr:LOW QUALITY PROTEIN: tRNA-dihydrouridine(20) synthase [NAD(P)+]-like [Haliotis rubra]
MPVDYRQKVILAPMVRVCTIPMRLLALEYGADLVYCEEIIDFKILSAERKVNGECIISLLLEKCLGIKPINIFQLGTSDAKRALMAAKKVENDVSALDINMGCPKEFSIKGGMGAALLSNPEKIKEILTTLVSGLSIPVTCKIRILPKLEDTLKLVKVIESTGVAAIAVHGRTKYERSRHHNRNDVIRAIAEHVSIPVIANGGSRDIKTLEEIKEFWKEAGTSSVMIARAAEWNVSVFRPDGPLPLHEVIKKYLRFAAEYDNNAINTKYCVLQIMHETMKEPEGQAMLGITTMEEIYDIWDMKEFYSDVLKKRKAREEKLKRDRGENDHCIKRRKTDDGSVLYEFPVRFVKKDYPVAVTPKQRLYEWCKRNRVDLPKYNTVDRVADRCFNSIVTVQGVKYTTPFWEKSKPLAEQGAAIACMITLGEDDGRLEEAKHEKEAMHRKWAQFNSQTNNDDSNTKRKTNSDLTSEEIGVGTTEKGDFEKSDSPEIVSTKTSEKS